MILYHGSKHKIEKFTDEFVGKGHDQEGPGIYLTSNKNDAWTYSEENYIYTIDADINNLK